MSYLKIYFELNNFNLMTILIFNLKILINLNHIIIAYNIISNLFTYIFIILISVNIFSGCDME